MGALHRNGPRGSGAPCSALGVGGPPMQVERGDVWWTDLPVPQESEPGHHRPVVVVQSDMFNRSALATVVCVALTTNLALTRAPGNVLVPRRASGLPQDSVANISQIAVVPRSLLRRRSGRLAPTLMGMIDDGLRLVLEL